MAQPEALRAPPPCGGGRRASARTTASCARSRARRRRCAPSCSSAFLAIAALLVLVGVVGLRFLGQSNARVEGLGTLQLRSSTYRDAADSGRACCGSCSPSASVAIREPQRSPARKLARRTAMGPRRRGDPVCAVAARALDERGDLWLRSAHRPTSACSGRIRRDYHTFRQRDSTSSPTLDGAGVTGHSVTPSLVRAIDADNDLYAGHERSRRTDEQRDRGADRREPKRLHLLAQPLHRRRRGQRRAGGRPRPAPLLVADRADPAHGGAARRDRRG